MKKKYAFLTSAICLASLINVSASANEFKSLDNSMTTKLCMTIVSGNRAAMHNQIKESGLSRRHILENVKCNGESLLAFADKYGRNSEAMLNMLDKTPTNVSISDIAANTIIE